MLNRSEIFRTAWAAYRATSALLGDRGAAFDRARFTLALRMAWYDAKQLAFYTALEAEEAAEAIANPGAADARAELTFLNMKDRWTSEDRARVSTLHHAIAA